MRKYYYYVVNVAGEVFSMKAHSDIGCFDIAKESKKAAEFFGQDAVIIFWHEISSEQYENI